MKDPVARPAGVVRSRRVVRPADGVGTPSLMFGSPPEWTLGPRRRTVDGVDEIEVFHGTAAEGLRWIVRASVHDEDRASTMLHVYRGQEHLSGSGFRGPRVQDGGVLHEWRGRTDDQPWFVMVCAAPEVTRVVATTDQDAEVELALSDVVRIHGVRYAVADLPRGHGPGSIRAEVDGTVVGSRAQPVLTPSPGASGTGWSPWRG
jgi:hypothetical protein